jgi:hypothetical protein
MERLRRIAAGMAAAFLASASPYHAQEQGFLHSQGTRMVDGESRSVLLCGIGLGGWMLQEGYMLGLGDLEKGQQHVVRRRIAETIAEAGAERFYRAWLDNFVTKADVDAMAGWGFNSVRLPMHYDLLTLPIEKEPAPGKDTWLESGFERIDRLLEWTRANGMYPQGRPYVTGFQSGEWMQYALDAEAAGTRTLSVTARGGQGSVLSLSLNSGAAVKVPMAPGSEWRALRFSGLGLLQGNNRIVLKAESCADCEVRSLVVASAGC